MPPSSPHYSFALALGDRYYWTARPRAAAPVYQIGETLNEIPQFSSLKSRKTLLVVLSPACEACTHSMPLYRKLQDKKRLQDLDLAIVAVGRRPLEELTAYVSEHEFTPDLILTLGDDALFKVRVTPTLILLDGEQVVAGFWEGRLSPDSEDLSLMNSCALEQATDR